MTTDRTASSKQSNWRKSTYSGIGNCVEVADGSESVLVRDSKHLDGSALSFSRATWGRFTTAMKQGEFTPPF